MKNIAFRTTLHGLAVVCLLLTSSAAEKPSSSEKAAWKRLAALGSGFVVWESNRSPDGDRWRIMYRDLDGGGFRQLSPDEASRDHCGAAVSPDGKWVAYLSLPSGTGYNDYKGKSPAHIIGVDGRGDRVVADDARRISGGNRAFVWIDATRLAFLDRDGMARSVDIATGQISEPLITNERGFIPDPTLRHAFSQGRVCPYDANGRKVQPAGPNFKGCEPMFTQDGRWSLRMTSAGGPIDRVDPSSYAMTPVVRQNDDRLPEGRRYVYFPNVSPCNRLVAWGASPNQHDHHRSDYEIFLAPIDPVTLMLQGEPVRYSFDGRTDRYPAPFLKGGRPEEGRRIAAASR